MSERRDYVMARAAAALVTAEAQRDTLSNFLALMTAPDLDDDDREGLLAEAMDEAHSTATAIGQAQDAFAQLSKDELALDEGDLIDDDDDDDEDDEVDDEE